MTKPFNLVCEDYTVYLLVGSSNCGKSTLANKILLELGLKHNARPVIISSDDIRRELTNEWYMDKYHPRMLEVSQQAFNLLYAKLRNYISYPVNKKFVIVDSTGLNQQFRTDILNICRDHNYKVVCILFDYKNREDWFANDGGDKFVIQKHIDKLKKNVLSNLRRSDYHKVITVTERIDEVNINYIPDKNNLVVEGNNCTVIGDVHGCVDELKQLVSKIDNVPILVGDWIDTKCNDSNNNAAIIDYLLANPQILTVKGNHEENLYKHINNNDYTESPFFNSRQLMSISDEYKAKFIELYNRSYTSIRGQGFIVTHAPCKSKYLLTSLDKMTNLYYKTEEKSDIINSIYDAKYYNGCWPLHLYGHLTFDKPVKTKFSIGLDTGVGYGGLLTGYNVATRKFLTVKSDLDDNSKQLDSITKFAYPVEDLDVKLDDEDTKRFNSFVRNKVPYISGTMCPADKTNTTLEDIKTVLSYFASTGQTQVLIQPKYMGSRAQVLLYRNDNKISYDVFTRNGFKLRHTSELDDAISRFRNDICNSEKLYNFIDFNGKTYSVLFDCELMPWSYLGKGLIKDTYEPYYYSHKMHVEAMVKYGFYKDLNEYKDSDDYINNVVAANKDASVLSHWRVRNDLITLNMFGKELDKYRSNEDPYFMPFNILKLESDIEVLYSNSWFNKFDNYELLSMLPTPLHVVNVNDLTEAIRVQKLYGHLEGIVVKPYYNVDYQAPYIKVRNTDYLRLVYGHDYTSKLDKFISKKSIKGKLRVSINEWQLGNELLDIHSSNFNNTNKEYTNTLIKLMFELKKEQGLDPRL